MKPHNLSLLLDLLQKITGVENEEDPLVMIRKGVLELKKNKRLDPDLLRKMKKSKIFDPEVLDGTKKIGEKLHEDVRDENNQDNVDNVTIQDNVIAPSLFAPEIKLSDPAELYSMYPREGWWKWVISKALVNEPATRSWYEIAMRELGQFKDNVYKKYRAFQQQNRVSMAESEEHGCEDCVEDDDSVIWTDRDREEYLDIIKDIDDTDYDKVNGIDYDEIDGFLSDKSVSDLEDEMYGADYLSPAEIADIDKEVENMSDDELEAMAAQYDFEESSESSTNPSLQEALSRMQRLKRKMMMKRIKAKIAIGRKRKARRMHTLPELMILARRKAELMLKMKFSHMTAAQYREAPVAVKQRIEDRVKKKESLINRLAKKILPKLRKADKEKLQRRAMKK